MEDTTSEDLPPHSRLSAGCILCYEGAKMVLFITGLCHRSCWYCPLSRERKDRDCIYANEHEISSPDEMIRVAERMSAQGTGITGGEPFAVPERLAEYARALKDVFGPGHHIHLYTGMAPTKEELLQLRGLVDEIRFHPPHETWPDIMSGPYFRAIVDAKKTGFDVGVEVPSLTGIEHFTPLLEFLDFFNINELEWGDSNADEMRKKGYLLRGDVSNAVAGAFESVESFVGHGKVHWCSSDFKDRVQLRKRLIRVAANTSREFDEITDDGTIVYGVWKCNGLTADMPSDLDPALYARFTDHIEMAWWILDEFASRFPGEKQILERYPDNGILIEVTPL